MIRSLPSLPKFPQGLFRALWMLPVAVLGTELAVAQPLDLTFTSPTQAAYSADTIDIEGRTLGTVTLAAIPTPPLTLMGMENTGPDYISGRFDNAQEGDTLEILHEGQTYPFIASYYGGSGNDFTLTLAIPYPQIALLTRYSVTLEDGELVSPLRPGVVLGSSTEFSIQIQNKGSAPLDNLTFTISGPNAQDFIIDAATLPPITTAQPEPLPIRFQPTGTGLRNATLTISSNDPVQPTFTLSLQGEAMTTFSPHFMYATGPAMEGRNFDLTTMPIGTATLAFAPIPGQILIAFTGTDGDLKPGRLKGGEGDRMTGTYNGQSYDFHIVYMGSSILLHTYYLGMPDLNFLPENMGSEATGVGPWQQILNPSYGRMNFLRKDGSVDTSMPFSPYSGDPSVMLMQMDGRFISRTANELHERFLVDGTPDTSFQPITNEISRLIQLRDGRIACLIHTDETGFQIRFLLADGTPDPAHPGVAVDRPGWALAEQEDGKILVAGVASGVMRLNADGTGDPTFQCTTASIPSVAANVSAILPLPDGKILIGGPFRSVNGASKNFLARLNSDGSTDTTFSVDLRSTASGGIITTFLRLNDGRVFAGGNFNSYFGPGTAGTRYGFVSLTPNGTLDPEYDLLKGFTSASRVRSINMLSDGSILLSGLLESGPHSPTKSAVRRFLNIPATSTLTVTPGTGISWVRNGEAADFSHTTFEYRGDGETAWTPMANGARDGNGVWRCNHTGMLPASGFIRVKGRLNATNRSSSVVMESHLIGRTQLTAVEQWRKDHFGDPTNEGPAAGNMDADRDGIRNLMEYALGLDPRSPDQPSTLPVWTVNGAAHEISFTPPAGLAVTYGAEWSTTLRADDWHAAQEIPGAAGTKSFRVPHDAPGTTATQLFFRLKVSE